MSWRASDGAGVVFSLALSGPDGKGLSSSSPRCIWQQLLFTAGYCTSLFVSSFSLSSASRISRGRERLPHIFTLGEVFRFNPLTSVSHFFCIQMYSAALCVYVSASVLLACSTGMRINLFIYRYMHAFVVTESICQNVCCTDNTHSVVNTQCCQCTQL